jgi:hypothetical protein
MMQSRVVNEAAPGAAADLVRQERGSQEEADAAADRAETLMAEGDFAGALETVRAALLRTPGGDAGGRLRDLRVQARRLFLKTAIVDAVVEVRPARITEGTTLQLRIRLRNLAPVPMVLESKDGVSSSVVRLEVVRTAWDVFGNSRDDTWEETHPLPEGEAPSGGELTLSIPFATERFRGAFPRGFVEYSFGGSVLPSGMRVGDIEIFERIPLTLATADSFPARWEEVASDPEAALERGLDVGNPVRLMVAARCAEGESRTRVAVRLAERLASPPTLSAEMDAGVRAALRMMGGDPEADAWTPERWRRFRGEGFAAEPAFPVSKEDR